MDSQEDSASAVLPDFSEDFIESLVEALPGASFINRSNPTLTTVVQRFIDNFNIRESEDDDDEGDDEGSEEGDDDIDDDFAGDPSDNDPDDDRKKRLITFNPREFVEALVNALGDAVVRALGNGNRATEQCVREVASAVVNGQAVANTAQQIQRIRQAISTLIRIGAFLEAQKTALAQATFLDECVTKFIDLAFCSRCTQKTPPLCFNTCNALLRVCYSPYYTTLNRQYSRLWTIAQQVVTIANTTVRDILAGEEALIDTTTFVARVAAECRVTVPQDTPTRSESQDADGENHDDEGENNDENPDRDDDNAAAAQEGNENEDHDEDREEESVDTTGDSDSSRGARGNGRMISFALVDDIFELRGAFDYRGEGLQLCLGALDDSDNCTVQEQPDINQRYCNGSDICTAKCYCTDGEGMRDRDTDPFLFSNIVDQGNNPVLPIDEDVLAAQAAKIAEQNPVTTFLTSSAFTSVAPDGVETGVEEEDDDDGATLPLVSVTILLLGLLLTFV